MLCSSPPSADYPLWDALGGVTATGGLSQLQLEGVLYACTKHLTWLPSGERCGFFIGGASGEGRLEEGALGGAGGAAVAAAAPPLLPPPCPALPGPARPG